MARQWKSTDTDSWNEAFGPGDAGSTYSTPENEGCSGTSGTTSLTLAAAGSFTNDMLVLIHQTRGTGAGSWELNKISSGGGTTSLTMAYDLQNTYTDSGASQAQVIEMKSYDSLSITATHSVPDWDGSKGGLIGFFNKGTLSGTSGIIDANGSTGATANGTVVQSAVTTGGGFRGGYGVQNTSNPPALQGESSTGYGTVSPTANGSGGGGGQQIGAGSTSGGGAGHAASGATGSSDEGTDGTGGGTDGNASLTDFNLGAGGGGCASYDGVSQTVASGGSGGGGLFIFSQDIDLTSLTFRSNGGNGGNGSRKGDGGGGAGGSILLKCETATLGTNKITANAGSGGSDRGGNGSVGRIHIDYSGSFTGTTTPTIDSTLDTTIVSGVLGGAFLLGLI